MVKAARKTLKNRKRSERRDRRERNRRRTERRDRRNRRVGGDAYHLNPSPINESLADSWPSTASLRQGADYFKYHTAQHGGSGYQVNVGGAPLAQITGSVLPSDMAGAAHTQGLNKAYADIIGLKDGGDTPLIVQPVGQSGPSAPPSGTTGGRRRRGRGRTGKSKRRDRRRRTVRRRRGGALGYASVSAPTMLLDAHGYNEAGLNPQYKDMTGSAEWLSAKARDEVL